MHFVFNHSIGFAKWTVAMTMLWPSVSSSFEIQFKLKPKSIHFKLKRASMAPKCLEMLFMTSKESEFC